jgi:Fe-S-cluster containining protein
MRTRKTYQHPTPTTSAREEVAAIYRELAERPLERACTGRAECCQFKLTGKTPFLTRGEALLVAEALRRTGRKQLRDEDANGTCPLLDPATLRCLVYDARPFGCRTHFCKAAGGPYARGEVQDLIHRLEKIDRALGGNGGQHLRHAVEQMLQKLPRPPR